MSSAMNDFNPRVLRRLILDMAFAGNAVHIGCAFSIVELLAVIYGRHLHLDLGNPAWGGRDYLVLSKGHGVMAQYACLNLLGWITDAELNNYFGNGSRLKGLADAHIPGVEATTGSLGHGLSVAAGMALAAKLSNTGQTCYALVGDGELNEGAIWEAMLFAKHYRLDNLVVIVDNNGLQAMGRTDEVMGLGDIAAKFEAFGFDAASVPGHDEAAIDDGLSQLKARVNSRPKVLVAHTIKGKGVSFMEDNNEWHYTRLTPETHRAARAELGFK